jgi:predicted DNA-binding transcriptional regulator YafY
MEEIMEQQKKEGIDVVVRTFEKDIRAMRNDPKLNFHAPISHSRKDGGYFYEDPTYTIHKVPIAEEEMKSLRLAAKLLQQHKGLPVFEQFEGTVEKLVTVVNQLDRPRKKNSIEFEKAPFHRGREYLEQLLDMIEAEQPLRIEYKKFDGQKSTYTIHPYLLKEYKKRWYLFGYNEGRKIVAAFGLDRIERISKANVFFIQNTFDPEVYFRHTIGVTAINQGKNPERIILAFDNKMSPYIKTQEFHETQKIIKDDENGVTIELSLVINPELISIIMSYGANVKVIAPKILQKEIIDLIDSMSKMYK